MIWGCLGGHLIVLELLKILAKFTRIILPSPDQVTRSLK